MDTLRFLKTCMILTAGRLRRQLWLLAGLALLCLLLPFGAGQAARQLLSQGVEFSGVTLAVAAPAGDDTAALLEQYMGGMEDIAQYCRIVAMEESDALGALADGEVTAVLCLPERFIQGVMQGENPDLRLIVAGDRPLESLLLLWVGQSATDILSAFQSGIYAVLDLYAQNPPAHPGWDQVVTDINLRYITLALDRTGFFRMQEVSATDALPIALHYALSLLAYFGLASAPLLMPLYTGGWLGFQRRLRCAGRGCGAGFFAGVTAGALALLVLLLPALLFLAPAQPMWRQPAHQPPAPLHSGEILPVPTSPAALAGAAGAAVLLAVFCSLFAALCCLLTQSAAGCGGMAFAAALLSLLPAGGVVPPVLLPAAVRRLSGLSPITWLRQLAAWPMGYDVPPFTWVCVGLSMAGMAALAFLLYRKRTERGEVAA